MPTPTPHLHPFCTAPPPRLRDALPIVKSRTHHSRQKKPPSESTSPLHPSPPLSASTTLLPLLLRLAPSSQIGRCNSASTSPIRSLPSRQPQLPLRTEVIGSRRRRRPRHPRRPYRGYRITPCSCLVPWLEPSQSRIVAGGLGRTPHRPPTPTPPLPRKMAREIPMRRCCSLVMRRKNGAAEVSKPTKRRRKDLVANPSSIECSGSGRLRRRRNVPVVQEQEKRKIDNNSNMCHQCQRNDNGRVVCCQSCIKLDKKFRYCVKCIKRWFVPS